jgi:acyl carrier protein
MKNEEIFNLIAKALEVPPEKITIDTTSKNIDAWDSLGHLNILMAMDKKFSGKISKTPEFASIYSVKKIIETLIRNKII